MLRLTGRDALDLLHRISTQALLDLPPGGSRATLFCDFRGRLLHRAHVVRDADFVWLVRHDAPASELLEFVDRHRFREDVRLEDRPVSEAPALPEDERSASEAARITAGVPRHGREIAEEFTPFEIGRAHEVHLSKGCFTGQEALMRLMTYKSVRRRLVRVAGHGAPPATPATLTLEGERVGRLTSNAALEGDGAGRWIGLAVVTHLAVASGAGFVVEGADTLDGLEAFPLTRPLGLPEPTEAPSRE